MKLKTAFLLLEAIKVMCAIIIGAAVTFVIVLLAFAVVWMFNPLGFAVIIVWTIASAGIFNLLAG